MEDEAIKEVFPNSKQLEGLNEKIMSSDEDDELIDVLLSLIEEK